jgi:DNA-directed RNA polymerase specialized sigma24 family protein
MKTIAPCCETDSANPASLRRPGRAVEFWSDIYGFMLRRGLSHHDAQDSTQSFFLKLAHSGCGERWEQEAESELHFRNLLLRSAANHCNDEYRRRRQVRRGGAVPHSSLDADDTAHDVACAQPTPCEAANLGDLKQGVNLAIEAVKQRHAARGREAEFALAMNCLLNDAGHGSQKEAARAAHLKENAFRALLFRIRRELAGALRPECAA